MESKEKDWREMMTSALEEERNKLPLWRRISAKPDFKFGIALLLIANITLLATIMVKPDTLVTNALVLATLVMTVFAAMKIEKSLPSSKR